MKVKPTMWWRRARKTDSPRWHYVKTCHSLPWPDDEAAQAKLIVVKSNPKSGTKADCCQNLHKKS